MTEKLYYKDAYLKEFTAKIRSVEKTGDRYDVILDRTAFFPNEGGQSSDTGYIGQAPVVDVYEERGVIHHLTVSSPAVNGDTVECRLDFEQRFEKMQCHTAEHILCGIFHRLYGCENVGFHLGAEDVTFDLDKVLTRDQLDTVEELANRAVFDNIEVLTLFPNSDELSAIEYRSKLDLAENVRIVKIGEIDSCACCAPHVSRTGEIGIIKMLDFEKHRGGTRIYMTAGARALIDYRERYNNVKRISALLWEPQSTVADGLERYISDTEKLKLELKQARINIALIEADSVKPTGGNAVFCFENMDMDELRAFSNAALHKISGILVALTSDSRQGEEIYKYIISSNSVDLTRSVKEMNSALCGKGGGKSGMVQGSFRASLESIKAYFENSNK